MRPAREHGTRKGCHYYTTELLRRLVYSSERACPSHGRAKDLTDTRCWSSIFKRGCPSIFLQSCHSFTPHQTCSLLEGLFLPDLLVLQRDFTSAAPATGQGVACDGSNRRR